MKDAGERRSHRAETWKELGEEQGTRALFRENAFGAADAGIGFQRNLTEKVKNLYAFEAAKLKPDRVRGEGSQKAKEQRGKKAKASRARQSARGEQERHSRDRQTDLLDEYPAQQDYVSMANNKIKQAMHGADRILDWRSFGNERRSMPPTARHDKFAEAFAGPRGKFPLAKRLRKGFRIARIADGDCGDGLPACGNFEYLASLGAVVTSHLMDEQST